MVTIDLQTPRREDGRRMKTRQLQHDTGPQGGLPCRRCGLRYSQDTAYVPCFEDGDTFETWFERQHPEIQKLTYLERR